MMNQIFEQGGVQDRLHLQLLPRNRRSDHRENSGPDYRPDAERGQAQPAQRFLQPLLGVLRVSDQLVDALAAENLRLQIVTFPDASRSTLTPAALPCNLRRVPVERLAHKSLCDKGGFMSRSSPARRTNGPNVFRGASVFSSC